MARVRVEGADLVVRLGFLEGLAARRREVRVPVSALRRVDVETSWWRVLRGLPGPGRWAPGRCVGIRHALGGEDFVAVRAGSVVLCMDLGPGAPFNRVAVSVAEPERTGQAVRAAMPDEPAPAPEARQTMPDDPAAAPGTQQTMPDESPPAPGARQRPLLQHEGGTTDDHGRLPGVPSRTGTGTRQPPPDERRVRRANADRIRRDHVFHPDKGQGQR
ncbi:hypothetical protein [Streptomyces sp. WM6372]|uniref:hypothetical protein n=1 Tax=Streptomyces sp. WM6372 TaxID=1415555 RepID=UPI0007C76711|nr:hypothetical protein [Streptomyces sp. WM6372]